MSDGMSGYTHTENEGCSTGKIQYNSYREAQEVINYSKKHRYSTSGRRMNRLIGKKGKQLKRSYKCDVCGHWHITSQPNTK